MRSLPSLKVVRYGYFMWNAYEYSCKLLPGFFIFPCMHHKNEERRIKIHLPENLGTIDWPWYPLS